MIVKSIQTDFRSRKRDISISKPVVLITGDNQSGKTSLLDSITAALIGYIPRLGKSNEKNSSVIGYTGVASVKMTVSSGDKDEVRAFRLSGNQEDGFSKTFKSTPICAAAFDASTFMTAKPSERIEIIQSALAGTVANPSKVLNSIIEEAKSASGVEDLVFSFKKAGSFVDSVELIIQEVNEKIKAANDLIVRYSNSSLTVMENQEEPPFYDDNAHSDLINKSDEINGKISENEEQVIHLTARCQSLREILETHKFDTDLFNRLTSRLESLKSEHNELTSKLKSIQDANKPAPRKQNVCLTCGQAVPDKEEHNHPVSEEESELESSIIETEAKIASIEDDLRDYLPNDVEKSNMDEIRSSEDKIESLQKSIQVLQSELSLNESKISEFDLLKRKIEDYNRSNEQIAQIARQLDQAKVRHEGLKKAKEAINKKYREITESILNPVMVIANKILKDILPFPLENKGFDLGYTTAEGVWVKIEGFSGSEKAASVVAIAAALASESEHKIAVIDEVGIIAERITKNLVRNIKKAQKEGILHQVFMAGVGVKIKEDDVVQIVCLD